MTYLNHALYRLRTARINQLSVSFLLAFAMMLGTVAVIRAPEGALDSDTLVRITTQVGVVHLIGLAIQEVCSGVK